MQGNWNLIEKFHNSTEFNLNSLNIWHICKPFGPWLMLAHYWNTKLQFSAFSSPLRYLFATLSLSSIPLYDSLILFCSHLTQHLIKENFIRGPTCAFGISTANEFVVIYEKFYSLQEQPMLELVPLPSLVKFLYFLTGSLSLSSLSPIPFQ